MSLAISRSTALNIVWTGGFGLPFVVFLLRAAVDYDGWMTAIYVLFYGPLILVISLVLGAFMHSVPKTTPPTSQVWLPIAVFLFWCACNILGGGIALSDVSDQDDFFSPSHEIIPIKYEFEIVGLILGVGALGIIFMFVQIWRLEQRFRVPPEDQERETSATPTAPELALRPHSRTRTDTMTDLSRPPLPIGL